MPMAEDTNYTNVCVYECEYMYTHTHANTQTHASITSLVFVHTHQHTPTSHTPDVGAYQSVPIHACTHSLPLAHTSTGPLSPMLPALVPHRPPALPPGVPPAALPPPPALLC